MKLGLGSRPVSLQLEVEELFADLSVPEVYRRAGYHVIAPKDRDADQRAAHAAAERARYARNVEASREYRREQKRRQYAANPEKERARKRAA